MFKVDLQLQTKPIKAIIDTAAEVTIISDKVYENLSEKPGVLRKVKMNTAGRDLSMTAFLCGPFHVKLGGQDFFENIYVAPLQDPMLLGLDFMRKHKVLVNIPEEHIRIQDTVIPMVMSDEGKVAEVTVCKTTVIPPNVLMNIECMTDDSLSSYIVEPVDGHRVMVPPTAYLHSSRPKVCVVNLSDHNVTLRKGQNIAQASEANVIPPVPPEFSEPLYNQQMQECQVSMETETRLPDHLCDMYDRARVNLDTDQQPQLRALLIEFQDVFAENEYDLGDFSAVEHAIDTGAARPIKQRLRRTPVCFADEEEQHLQQMLQARVIQPSSSEWGSPPVLVRKRDGSVRWCVDYRALNNVTVKDVYPLPLVEDCMDMLSGNVWYSKLDANSAYWQIRIKPEDCKKTAFLTKYGLFEFVRMAFGLCNAPATYARAMNLVLHGLNWNQVLAFLDDMLALGKSFEGHLQTLREVFTRFRFYQLKLKPKKCELFQRRVEFLGRYVGPDGLEIGISDIQTVLDWPHPKSVKDVEKFLGLLNYHRSFIKDYAKKAAPLYQITGKKCFVWESEQEESFQILKKILRHHLFWDFLQKQILSF